MTGYRPPWPRLAGCLSCKTVPRISTRNLGDIFRNHRPGILRFLAYGVGMERVYRGKRSSYRALADSAIQECQWILSSHSRCNARRKLDYVAGTLEDAVEVFGMVV